MLVNYFGTVNLPKNHFSALNLLFLVNFRQSYQTK